MSLTVVCGVNWGDEGKGRIVDYLAKDADVVVRYQGGNNAGHTVVNEFGTFKLHLIPSGIFRPTILNVLGPGMVIDLEALVDEIDKLQGAGIPIGNIVISDRATVCFPFHRLEDEWEEERLGHRAYGSTKRGIAPAYGDRHLKKAIRVGDLLQPAWLRAQLQTIVEWKTLMSAGVYGKVNAISLSDTVEWAERFGRRLSALIVDTSSMLERQVADGKRLLFEAQLGALRDVYFGVYPFTSSSCALASFAAVGSGLFGHSIDRVVGVMKAFATCVGVGPFVTEMQAEVANALREVAFEYGAATGRPRRIGHFDAVASRYGAYLQGATEIALTKLDSLSGLSTLKICTAYRIRGETSTAFPLNSLLDEAEPEYVEMKAWTEDITSCRHFQELPPAARQYVSAIEQLIERRIRYISVGPERSQLIEIF